MANKQTRVIAGVTVAAIVLILLASYIAIGDDKVSGTYYVAEVNYGTFGDGPDVITTEYKEGESSNVDISVKGSFLTAKINEEVLRFSFYGNNFCGSFINEGGTVFYSGKVVDSKTVCIGFVSSEQQCAVTYVLVKVGAVSDFVSKSGGLNLEEGQTVTATAVNTNARNIDEYDVSAFTIKNLGCKNGIIFYQTTTDDYDGKINCIGIHSYNDRSFVSTYELNGVKKVDTIYSEKGYTNLSTAFASDSSKQSIHVWSVDFVQDNRVLVYPDLKDAVFVGTQNVYFDGVGPESKNLTVSVKQSKNGILTTSNSFGQDKSRWGVSIVPMGNGDYWLNIFGVFTEYGQNFTGMYIGKLYNDIQKLDILAFANSEDTAQICYAYLDKRDTSDSGSEYIGTYVPTSAKYATYVDGKPSVSYPDTAPVFEIVSIQNRVVEAVFDGVTIGGVYSGSGSFTLGDITIGDSTDVRKIECSVSKNSGKMTMNMYKFNESSYSVWIIDYQIAGSTDSASRVRDANSSSDADGLVKGDVWKSYEAYNLIDGVYTDNLGSFEYKVVDVIDGFTFTSGYKNKDGQMYESFDFVCIQKKSGSYRAFSYNNGTPYTDSVYVEDGVLYTGTSYINGGKTSAWIASYTKDGKAPESDPITDYSDRVYTGTDYNYFSNGKILDSSTTVTFQKQHGRVVDADIKSGKYTSDWTLIVVGSHNQKLVSASIFEYDGVTYQGMYTVRGGTSTDAVITGIAYGEDGSMVYIVFDLDLKK